MSRVGAALRAWRRRRGLSQQSLAAKAGVSQRHVSFLESGRSHPSEDMIERLADCLEVPIGDRNALLASGGFSPLHRDIGRPPREREEMESAVRVVIEMHPYPAIVMDRFWNVRFANAHAARVLAESGAGPSPNAMELCFDPYARAIIENWDELARMMLARLRREIAESGDDRLRSLLVRLEARPGVREISASEPEHDRSVSSLPVFPVRLRAGGLRAVLFTVVTAVGTAEDAAVDDLRIELYYPADEPTRALLSALESSPSPLLPAR